MYFVNNFMGILHNVPYPPKMADNVHDNLNLYPYQIPIFGEPTPKD
jgi:hypothetical protein